MELAEISQLFQCHFLKNQTQVWLLPEEDKLIQMHSVKEAATAECQCLEIAVFLTQFQVRGQSLMSYIG